jgi:hypothetical protein
VDGYEEQLADTSLRTQMDAGPAKVRRRFTAGVTTFQVSLPMTTAQVATFETFFSTTIAGGALAFDWVHPRTRAAVSMRIVTPPPPKIRPEAGAKTWTVGFSVEILP